VTAKDSTTRDDALCVDPDVDGALDLDPDVDPHGDPDPDCDVDGSRRLVVNADDLGLSDGVNAGILQAARHGIVTSASLMVRMPAAVAAACAARALPGLSVGLHLDLAEWVHDGEQWQPLYQVVDTGDADAVAEEVTRQLHRFDQLVGRPPSHLDSHQHVHRSEPVHGLLVAAGRRLGVHLRSQPGAPAYRGDFYGQTGKGEPYRSAISVRALCDLIATLPPGLTELGCHPGYSDDLESVYALEREVEARVLCAPEVLGAVRAAGVRLTAMPPAAAAA
jgi:predicted glycoside hydrolase/deacetylase ChbG (UPF0249 family)